MVQVTLVVSADAVPVIVIVASEVETMVKPGEMIFRVGRVVGGVVGVVGVGAGVGSAGGVGGVAAACRVMDSTRDAMLPAPSVAVTVMIFIPTFRGTTGILQLDEPFALPEGP